MMTASHLKIALGPLQYYWPHDAVFSFYEVMATAPVDVVCLGETVCSRRPELRLADWFDIALKLQGAGKGVVLSTQVLLESVAEVGTMHKIAANGKVPFAAGLHLNLYNQPSLQWMASLGGTPTCLRTTAASAAWTIPTACSSRPAKTKNSWSSTALRPSC